MDVGGLVPLGVILTLYSNPFGIPPKLIPAVPAETPLMTPIWIPETGLGAGEIFIFSTLF